MGRIGIDLLPENVVTWIENVPTAPIPPFYVIVCMCAGYLVFVLGGAQFMKNRDPIPLQKLQVAHNAIMFLYSLLSTIAMAFCVFSNTPYKTFNEMICDGENSLFSGFNSWVLFTFLLSKMWEFIDTVFLVLGKHRLRFLHVYHHVITLPLSWILYIDNSANGTICAWANMFVHTPMYYYYTIAALGGTVWWKKYITQIQITQFVFCIFLMIYDYILLRPLDSKYCLKHKSYPYNSILWSAIIYLTFLILFIKLYIDVYKSRKKAKSSEQQPKKKDD